MKKLINTILLALVFVAVKAAPVDSLQKANELYAANEYAKAIQLYEGVVAQGYESAVLYFNLGNSYYKNGEITKAILNYERAKKLAPNDDDIQFNLELMNQFVVDKIEPLPHPFFVKWLENIINLFTTNQWAKISLIGFVLALILALTYLFSRNLTFRKLSFTLSIVVLALTIITFVFSAKQKSKLTKHNHGIIFNPTVTVKASPAEGGTDLFVIHEGLKVQLIDSLNNWIEIRLEDGNTGWVQQDVLQII